MLGKLFGYVREVNQEMTKVSWPSRDELVGSTIVVLILSGILAIFIFGVDTILTNILKIFL